MNFKTNIVYIKITSSCFVYRFSFVKTKCTT